MVKSNALFAGSVGARCFIVLVAGLILMRLSSRAVGPDYLNNNVEPADQVSELPTPGAQTVPGSQLRFFNSTNFADQPFLQDAEFGRQPRLGYRIICENLASLPSTIA